MRRTFPSSGMRYRFHLWRDRRRYPWHYAEIFTIKASKITSLLLRWRLFVVRYTPGDPDVLIVAECPDYQTATVVSADRFHVFTQGEMLGTPKLRRALAAWDASMKGHRTHRATPRRPRWAVSAPRRVGVSLGAGTLSR
jgi:hypothetical protein